MSFEEKNTWIYFVLTAVVPGIYFLTMLGQVRSTPVGEIDYIGPMLTAIAIAIGLNILAAIVVSIASRGQDKADERDKSIGRFGEYIGYYVLSAGVAVALFLTFGEVAHFWIANMIYLAFVLASLTSSAVKIVVYRRGF